MQKSARSSACCHICSDSDIFVLLRRLVRQLPRGLLDFSVCCRHIAVRAQCARKTIRSNGSSLCADLCDIGCCSFDYDHSAVALRHNCGHFLCNDHHRGVQSNNLPNKICEGIFQLIRNTLGKHIYDALIPLLLL